MPSAPARSTETPNRRQCAQRAVPRSRDVVQHARATRLTNQSVFSLSSPMCRQNKGQSQLGTPQRRSHRGGEDTWSRAAGRKRSRLFQHTHGYRPDIDCEHSHPRFPPRLLVVLNHGHWLLLNIGRFSIDECLKDEQFVHQDPTHRHFIAPLTPPRRPCLASWCRSRSPRVARAVGSLGRH